MCYCPYHACRPDHLMSRQPHIEVGPVIRNVSCTVNIYTRDDCSVGSIVTLQCKCVNNGNSLIKYCFSLYIFSCWHRGLRTITHIKTHADIFPTQCFQPQMTLHTHVFSHLSHNVVSKAERLPEFVSRAPAETSLWIRVTSNVSAVYQLFHWFFSDLPLTFIWSLFERHTHTQVISRDNRIFKL